MGQQSTVIYPEVMKSFASASMTSSFQALGTSTSDQTRIMKLVNDSTEGVTVSWDGVNAHDYVRAGSDAIYSFATNRSNDSPFLVAQSGTQLFVKGTAGTGNVYLVTFFGVTPNQTAPL